MASDITLAVGDGARRMTYAELADMRRISLPSAERLVRRKRLGPDNRQRWCCPRPRAPRRGAESRASRGVDKAAVSALSAQLEHERDRAVRAERRVEALHAALIDERGRVLEILTGPSAGRDGDGGLGESGV